MAAAVAPLGLGTPCLGTWASTSVPGVPRLRRAMAPCWTLPRELSSASQVGWHRVLCWAPCCGGCLVVGIVLGGWLQWALLWHSSGHSTGGLSGSKHCAGHHVRDPAAVNTTGGTALGVWQVVGTMPGTMSGVQRWQVLCQALCQGSGWWWALCQAPQQGASCGEQHAGGPAVAGIMVGTVPGICLAAGTMCRVRLIVGILLGIIWGPPGSRHHTGHSIESVTGIRLGIVSRVQLWWARCQASCQELD